VNILQIQNVLEGDLGGGGLANNEEQQKPTKRQIAFPGKFCRILLAKLKSDNDLSKTAMKNIHGPLSTRLDVGRRSNKYYFSLHPT
jgi:hypothetical protein